MHTQLLQGIRYSTYKSAFLIVAVAPLAILNKKYSPISANTYYYLK